MITLGWLADRAGQRVVLIAGLAVTLGVNVRAAGLGQNGEPPDTKLSWFRKIWLDAAHASSNGLRRINARAGLVWRLPRRAVDMCPSTLGMRDVKPMPRATARRSDVYYWTVARRVDSRGFSLIELLVLMAVVAIITTVSAPAFVSYWRSATLQGGARELATLINRGRQLAISQNTTVCVNQSANKVQFLKGGCAGTVWTGPGTDGGGWFTLANGVTVSSTTANVVFNFMGAATTSGVYTVTNPINNASMHVTVSLAGRVTVGP